jgi:serine/threonine protein kinase
MTTPLSLRTGEVDSAAVLGPRALRGRNGLMSPASAPAPSSPSPVHPNYSSDSLSTPEPSPTNIAVLGDEAAAAAAVASAVAGSSVAALPASHSLSSPPEGHKKAGSSVTIPPSRAWKLAHAVHAGSSSSAGSSTSSSTTTRRAPPARRNKLHGNSRAFEQDYTLLPHYLLGSGASGSVYVCTSRRNPKHEYAVKVINRDADMDETAWREEMQLLATVRHRNIIRLKDVYETPSTIHIVTELAYGGELFERILKTRSFSERDVVDLARKLFHAIAYLHSLGIVHRDLKPENILFAKHEENADVKLSDFGFARNLLTKPRNLRARTQLGSFGFMAPEIFSGRAYDERCDVWSLSCVIYICLSGLPPFVDSDVAASSGNTPFWMYTNAMCSAAKKPVEFPDGQWKHISDSAKNFLAACLELDPSKRMRSIDALNHPWLKRKGKTVSGTMAPATHTSPPEQLHSASATPPGKDQTHAPLNVEQQRRYLTLTLNKTDATDLARMTEEVRDAASKLDFHGSDDAPASLESSSSMLPPPLGGPGVGLATAPVSVSGHPGGSGSHAAAAHALSSSPPPSHPHMIRSASHDPPNALPPLTPPSHSLSVSRADSLCVNDKTDSAGATPLTSVNLSVAPIEHRGSHSSGLPLHSGIDSTPGSTMLTRNNSVLPPPSPVPSSFQVTSPYPVSMTPMSPLLVAPGAAPVATAMAGGTTPGGGGQWHESETGSSLLHPTAAAADGDAVASASQHRRDSSSASSGSSATGHSQTARRLMRPQQYATLPQQYLQDDDEEDEAAHDTHSTDDEEPSDALTVPSQPAPMP